MIKYNSQFGNLTKRRHVESCCIGAPPIQEKYEASDSEGVRPFQETAEKAYEDRERGSRGVVKCGVTASC